MEQQIIDLEKKTLDELKVLAYDCSVQVNVWNKNLQEIEKAIQKKLQVLPVVKEETPKKEVSK